MTELYFRIGETEGFTSKKLADKKSGYAIPIRELLQNSLDAFASKESSNEKCEINIYIENIKKSNIPHITDYEKTLDQAIKFQTQAKSFNHNQQQTAGFMQEALKQDELSVLMFVDNGIGISPEILDGLIGDRSIKSNESSAGSFGVGHLSPYFLSSLQYILYATKYKEKDEIKHLFSGAPILAGFEDEEEKQRSNTGRIVERKPNNECNPKFIYPTKYPDFIADKMKDVDTGSMIVILGLNTTWEKEANYAIVSNFFYAINKQNLCVNIINHDLPTDIINQSNIEEILSASKEGEIAKNSILSGSATYQSWLTVNNDNYKKEIELKNGDKVCVYIRNNIQANSVIAMIRNGMLIARHDKMLSSPINNLRKNDNFEPFSIVINVIDSDSHQLFKLVKGAENPYHNELKKGQLNQKNEQKLKKILEELSEEIKKFLQKKDRENFNLNLPLLEIPNKAQAQGSNTSRPKSQTSKAKPDTNRPKPPIINKIKATNNGKKRPSPVINSRFLEAKNSMRIVEDKGDTIDVELNIVPQKMEIKDEVYLSMSLAQDKDSDENTTGLDFISLSINEANIEIPEFVEVTQEDGNIKRQAANKSQIKLGVLSKPHTYSIKATIQKPKNIKNINVALRPFLGLKKRSK